MVAAPMDGGTRRKVFSAPKREVSRGSISWRQEIPEEQTRQTKKEKDSDIPRLLSAKEVGEILGMSVKQVHKLARQGKLAYVNAGRARRVSKEVTEEFVRARAVGCTSDQAIGTKDRKEQAYNCLGNLNWFLDAFLLWASEVTENAGDCFPSDEQIVKASPEEVREYVRRTRCNVRVLQAIIDASIFYENLYCPLDKQELIDSYNESLKLYRSTDKFIHGFDAGQTGLQNPDPSSYLD